MTHEEAFFQDIREHPGEDAPRLIYADWLDDQEGSAGRPAAAQARVARAEFIRAQCELARGVADRPRERALRRREWELAQAHQAEWLAPLWTPRNGARVAFHRGMATVRVEAHRALAEAPEWYRRAGVLGLRLRWQSGPLNELRASPALGQVVALAVDQDHFEWEVAEDLATAPQLAGLRRLDLCFDRMDGGCLEALAASPYLQNLTHLGPASPWAGVEEGDLDALVRPGVFPHLTSLRLSGNPLSREFLTRLLQTAYGPRLTALDLSDCDLGNAGVQALFGVPRRQALTCLRLGGNGIGLQGLRDLASTAFPNLTALDLSGNAVGGLALASSRAGASTAILESSGMPRLSDLNLAGVRLGDAGLKALARSPGLARLTALHLERTGLTEVGVRALVESPHALHLAHLDLSENDLSSAALRVLAAAPTLAGLLALRLGGNRLGRAAFKAIGGSPHLAGLVELDLGYFPLDDDLAGVLAGAPRLDSLTKLAVGPTRLGSEALRRLRRRFGAALETQPFVGHRKSVLIHEHDLEGWPD